MDDAEAGGADDADGADGPDDAAGDCELFSSGAETEGVDVGETSVMIGKLHAFVLANKFDQRLFCYSSKEFVGSNVPLGNRRIRLR